MTRTEESLKKRVVDQLYWDDRVDASDISVEVHGSTVKLSGNVPSYRAREDAVLDAWTIDGVSAVENEIEVEFPTTYKVPTDDTVQTKIDNRLLWNTYIDSTDVHTKVDAGFVQLEGTVDAYWKKIRAKQLASDVDGVIKIQNELAVVPTESIVDKAIAEDITSALDRNLNVDVDDVDVRVKNGEVTLTGTVPSWSAYRAAINAAEFTAGVIEIEDSLKIE
ncbi:BON domain-containing protein [Candidatus Thorarchaeota archaeon]|nr:MAG: BON domain-containing protein [Candidatus Thorarchaeota archaeon]